MPRCFSISIQSLVAWRVALRAFTLPAMWIAPANSRSFSVSVVLPASGCEMIAKVLRRAVSSAIWDSVVMGAILRYGVAHFVPWNAERAKDCAGIAVDDVQQDQRRPARPAGALLPMPERRHGKTESPRELLLCKAAAQANRPDVDGVWRPLTRLRATFDATTRFDQVAQGV